MPEQTPVQVDTSRLGLLVQLGFNPGDVMRRASLPLELLAQPTARISVSQFTALWVALEALAPVPTFPIAMGKASLSGSFHGIAFAALCSSNLRIAVSRVRDYKRLVAPERFELHDGPEAFEVVVRWNDPDAERLFALNAMSAVFLVELARTGLRAHVLPSEVVLPASAPHAAFREFFGVEPIVGPHTRVRFRNEDADRPFLTVSDSMWAVFEPSLRQRLAKLGASSSLSTRVRDHLLECLPAGEASAAAVAKRLGVSRRTLQRQLAQEGAAFNDVVREVREQLAMHYLTRTTVSYPEIALLVGYDEPSSFFRAFKRWTGSTPEVVRTRQTVES